MALGVRAQLGEAAPLGGDGGDELGHGGGDGRRQSGGPAELRGFQAHEGEGLRQTVEDPGEADGLLETEAIDGAAGGFGGEGRI